MGLTAHAHYPTVPLQFLKLIAQQGHHIDQVQDVQSVLFQERNPPTELVSRHPVQSYHSNQSPGQVRLQGAQ